MLRRASLILRVAVLKVRRRRGADRGYGGTWIILALFFFQAEDGIRDHCVTGVQTSALPILDAVIRRVLGPALFDRADRGLAEALGSDEVRFADPERDHALDPRHKVEEAADTAGRYALEIGRASCRERV